MRYIKIAKALAHTSSGKYRVAALLFNKKGDLLSSGVNSYQKSHPLQKHYALKVGISHSYLHAEIAAIARLKGKKPYKLLLVRIGKRQNLLPIDPCPICSIALKEHGVKVIEKPF